MKRREFLFGIGLGGIGLDWFPFFHPKFVTLAGIPFQVLRNGRSHRRYLLIHGDEPTAREVLTIHMETHPGIAYLVAGKERNVPLDVGKLDPNRMFSRIGAEANLKKLNPDWTPEKLARALDFLDDERETLVGRLTPPEGGLLIALHNNRNYSVQDEVADSDRVSIKQPERPREFFLCTDPRDYAVLVKSPYNVVLQNRKPAIDDGSLSRLAAHRGFRYVNLECGVGQFEAQIERLGWADRNLV
ncbi:MAG: hypothetical protein M3Y07_00915 [Acidobacteriota bacterium]|nr:hypothetical protein [Acidobacteriota bacterium]